MVATTALRKTSMYSKSKYIVGIPKHGYVTDEIAIVFSEHLGHTDFREVFVEGSITSGGFCHFDKDDVSVYGKSIGLNVDSKPSDSKLVGRAMSHPKYAT
jgi:hypothetical protein